MDIYPDIDGTHTTLTDLADGHVQVEIRIRKGRLLAVTRRAGLAARLRAWQDLARRWTCTEPIVSDRSINGGYVKHQHRPPSERFDDRSTVSLLYAEVTSYPKRDDLNDSVHFCISVTGGIFSTLYELDYARRIQEDTLKDRHDHQVAYWAAWDALPEPITDHGAKVLFDLQFEDAYCAHKRRMRGRPDPAPDGRSYNRRHFHACGACGGSGSYCAACQGTGTGRAA